MSTSPAVTVLMPVYNAQRYLRQAIESILQQTFTDFEFIIINDGSTDTSEEIILSYTDHRIKYIKNEQNIKLIATLNKGFALAQGKYIARMDADDVSLNTRLETQVNFMEQNPDIAMAGSWFESIGDIARIVKYEADLNALRFKLLYQTQFCHPTVILRKSILEQVPVLFDPAYIHAEDYELFSRIAYAFKVTTIPHVLLQYRVHNTNVSNLFKSTQVENSLKIMVNNFKALGIAVNSEEATLFEQIAYQNYPALTGKLNLVEQLLLKTIAADNNPVIAHPFLYNYAINAWFNICYNLISRDIQAKPLFRKSQITKRYLPFAQKFRFLIKSIPN